MTLSSTDVDDDGAPVGNGARTVQIYGLDVNYDEINETITLDGQNPVNTANQYLRIFRILVRSAGTTGYNEGTIYAGTGAVVGGVPANVYASITPQMCQTLMAMFTVPRDYTGYLTNVFASTGISNKTTEVFVFVRPFGEVFQVKKRYHIINGAVFYEYDMPLEITARSDIEVRAQAVAGGGAVSTSFDLWYEK